MPPHQHRTPYPPSIRGTLLLLLIPIALFQFTATLTTSLTARWYGLSSTNLADCPACTRPHIGDDGWERFVGSEQTTAKELAQPGPNDAAADDEEQVRILRAGDNGVELRIVALRRADEQWARGALGREARVLELVRAFCWTAACKVRWRRGRVPAGTVTDVLGGEVRVDGHEGGGGGEAKGNSGWDILRDERNDVELEYDRGRPKRVTLRIRPP